MRWEIKPSLWEQYNTGVLTHRERKVFAVFPIRVQSRYVWFEWITVRERLIGNLPHELQWIITDVQINGEWEKR